MWNPTRSASLRDAFAASGSPLAAVAYANVAARLDAYGASWTRSYQASCEATHVRSDQSPQLHELRAECLDYRLEVADAFIGTWIRRRGPIATAAASAEQLPPIADCADAAALRGASLPAPALAARVSELRTHLAKVYVLRQSNQLVDA